MINPEKIEAIERRFLPRKWISAQEEIIAEAAEDKWKFVVFIVRRSFLLALATASKLKIKDSRRKKWMTDSAFFVHTHELAMFYGKYGYFPEVLLVDDIIYKARNLNSLLLRTEELLCQDIEAMSGDDTIDGDEIRFAFRSAVTIMACAKVRGNSLLLTRYTACVKPKLEISIRQWHKISSELGLLVSMLDTANASFVYSVSVSSRIAHMMVKQERLIRTLYQGNEEYVLEIPEHNGDGQIQYMMTLRLVRVLESDQYRMIPLLLLPELDSDKRARLIGEICQRIDEDSSLIKLKNFLLQNESRYKRSQDEWVTWILSQVILFEYCTKYDIRLDDKDELAKLCHNYARPDETTAVRRELDEISHSSLIGGIEELRGIIDVILSDEDVLIRYAADAVNAGRDSSFAQLRLENFIYNREYDEIRHIHQLSKGDPIVVGEISLKSAFPTQVAFDVLCKDYPYEAVEYTVAYFLQMMDTGLIGVYMEDKRLTGSKSYIEYAKAAEMSLIIYPIRMYSLLSIVSVVYEYCSDHFLDFNQHIDEYAEAESCDIRDYVNEIKKFVKVLADMGEKPTDWIDGFFFRTDQFIPGDERGNARRMNGKSAQDQKYKEHYMAYVSNR